MLPNDPVFSIAVPAYGQSEYLGDALASLAAQSALTQVSVMDATPDDSVQRVIAAQSLRPAYVRHGPDAGQSDAIREGWERTGGDILGWLCADDCLFPGALADVAAVFREHQHVDVVYGDGVFIDRQGHFIRYFPSIRQDLRNIPRECCITQPSCFVRRSAVERVGGLRADLAYTMDWDLWTRLFLAGCKFRYVPVPLSASRMHSGTKTTTNSHARLSEIWQHLIRYNKRRDALRSMSGFLLAPLMYSELGSGGHATIGRMFRGVMSARRRFRGASHALPSLYGIDIVSNGVRGTCEIHIPYYRPVPPTHLVVSAEPAVQLVAEHEGILMRPVDPRSAAEWSAGACVFELPIGVARVRQGFAFAVRSERGQPWTLRGARIVSRTAQD
jgi:GT2 family glycosyltransferase